MSKTALTDASGKIISYMGELVERNPDGFNLFTPHINHTGINVYAGVKVDKDKNPMPDDQWASVQYRKKEQVIKKK